MFFFFKQKTAYEMRISDWSSDVCSSDLYGKALLGEVMEEQVNSALQKAIEDNKLRPAMQPKVDIVSFDEGKDLECTIAIEVLPEIEPGDFKKVKLERLVVEPGDAEVAEFMTRLTEQIGRASCRERVSQYV